MSKLRVHELAGELGRQNKEVIEFLKSRGVEVRSHMSMVDEPLISVVKNRFSNIYERVMAKYTVNPPSYDEESDSEILFDKIFGSKDDE